MGPRSLWNMRMTDDRLKKGGGESGRGRKGDATVQLRETPCHPWLKRIKPSN